MPGRLTCPAKFKMFVYILKNKRDKYYIGITKLKPISRKLNPEVEDEVDLRYFSSAGELDSFLKSLRSG